MWEKHVYNTSQIEDIYISLWKKVDGRYRKAFDLLIVVDGKKYWIPENMVSNLLRLIGIKALDFKDLAREDVYEAKKYLMKKFKEEKKDFAIWVDERGKVQVVASPDYMPMMHRDIAEIIKRQLVKAGLVGVDARPVYKKMSNGTYIMFKIKEDNNYRYYIYAFNRNDVRHSVRIGIAVEPKAYYDAYIMVSPNIGAISRVYHIRETTADRINIDAKAVAYLLTLVREKLEEASKKTIDERVRKIIEKRIQELPIYIRKRIKEIMKAYGVRNIRDLLNKIAETGREVNSITTYEKINALANEILKYLL